MSDARSPACYTRAGVYKDPDSGDLWERSESGKWRWLNGLVWSFVPRTLEYVGPYGWPAVYTPPTKPLVTTITTNGLHRDSVNGNLWQLTEMGGWKRLNGDPSGGVPTTLEYLGPYELAPIVRPRVFVHTMVKNGRGWWVTTTRDGEAYSGMPLDYFLHQN